MRSLIVVVSCLVPAFATGCMTFAEHRAALVPHATPTAFDGQPMSRDGEIALGASNLLDLTKPTAGVPDAGDAVPGTQLAGGLRARLRDNMSIGFIYQRGLASTATGVQTSLPKVDNGDLNGYGAQATLSQPIGESGLRLGIAVELIFWDVPWVQYTSCVQNCGGPSIVVDARGSDVTPTIALSLVPSYQIGRVTLFGGATARNQPTLRDKVFTTVPMDPEVSAGPFNVTLHAGASIDVGGGVKASVMVHQTVTTDPIQYGPALAAFLAIPFGDAAKQAPAGPPARQCAQPSCP